MSVTSAPMIGVPVSLITWPPSGCASGSASSNCAGTAFASQTIVMGEKPALLAVTRHSCAAAALAAIVARPCASAKFVLIVSLPALQLTHDQNEFRGRAGP